MGFFDGIKKVFFDVFNAATSEQFSYHLGVFVGFCFSVVAMLTFFTSVVFLSYKCLEVVYDQRERYLAKKESFKERFINKKSRRYE